MVERLGDQPIEAKYRQQMNELAEVLDKLFNGDERPRPTGFVLLVFPFNDGSGRCNYISNGADRKDVVALMKEQIRRFEGAPDVQGRA